MLVQLFVRPEIERPSTRMGEMSRPWQFSLGYLMLAAFWIAAALGLMLQAIRYPRPDEWDVRVLLLLGGTACVGAAIGGLFHDMRMGFVITLVVSIYSLVAYVVAWGVLWVISF